VAPKLAKAKAIPKADSQKLSSASSPAVAIAMREIKYLLRTPVYLFNSLAVLVIVPVILVIPLISGGISEQLNRYALRDEIPRLVQISALAGFIALMALFTPAASSSFHVRAGSFGFPRLYRSGQRSRSTVKFSTAI
jgi:hypothetical protein